MVRTFLLNKEVISKKLVLVVKYKCSFFVVWQGESAENMSYLRYCLLKRQGNFACLLIRRSVMPGQWSDLEVMVSAVTLQRDSAKVMEVCEFPEKGRILVLMYCKHTQQ